MSLSAVNQKYARHLQIRGGSLCNLSFRMVARRVRAGHVWGFGEQRTHSVGRERLRDGCGIKRCHPVGHVIVNLSTCSAIVEFAQVRVLFLDKLSSRAEVHLSVKGRMLDDLGCYMLEGNLKCPLLVKGLL